MILTDEDMISGPERAAPPRDERPYEEIPAINWSTLKHLAVSPRLLRWRVDHPQRDSRPLMLGRAIHCAVLEPERWEIAYVMRPDFGDLRTKAAKQARAEWLVSLSPGIEVLDPEDYAMAERCAAAVHEHPAASRLLRGGRAEEVITWTDEETGAPCKARVDLIAPMYILDLKSSRLDTLDALKRDFARRLYHGQLAMYHDGATTAGAIPPAAETPHAIIVQTVEPFDVIPARMTYEDLERGRSLYRSLLRRYVACQSADWWPGMAPDLIDLDLPAWAAAGDAEAEEDW